MSPKAKTQNTSGTKVSMPGAQPDHAEVPIDAAGPETTQQPNGGETDLSKAAAGSDAPDADAVSDTVQGDAIHADTVAPIFAAAQSADESSIEILQAQKTLIESTACIRVVCHVEEGRRRVGRRWPKGESLIHIGELDDYELAQLRGDPLFTVVMPV